MRRLVAVAFAVIVALTAGCGGGGDSAQHVLSETAANLGEIRSGDLSLTLLVDPKGAGEEFGFELQGPFSLAGETPLPVARVRYTQIANGQRGSATLISTGREAFVEIGSEAYELPSALEAELRAATGALRSTGGLEQLQIGDWIRDPELTGSTEIGGEETDHVTADLDVVAAVNDLIDVARGLGGTAVERLTGRDASRLRRAARSGTIDVYSGKDDRLLRRVEIHADLGLDVPDELVEALGRVVGAEVTFELRVGKPNRSVAVSAPESPRPSSELPGAE